jgi:hypothetical protein
MLAIHPLKCSECKGANCTLSEDETESTVYCSDCGYLCVSNQDDTEECLKSVAEYPDGWTCRECQTIFHGYMPAEIATQSDDPDCTVCKVCHDEPRTRTMTTDKHATMQPALRSPGESFLWVVHTGPQEWEDWTQDQEDAARAFAKHRWLPLEREYYAHGGSWLRTEDARS